MYTPFQQTDAFLDMNLPLSVSTLNLQHLQLLWRNLCFVKDFWTNFAHICLVFFLIFLNNFLLFQSKKIGVSQYVKAF